MVAEVSTVTVPDVAASPPLPPTEMLSAAVFWNTTFTLPPPEPPPPPMDWAMMPLALSPLVTISPTAPT